MVDNVKVTKPLGSLPPLRPKILNTTSIDFIQQFQAVCVGLVIRNRSGGDITYKLNDENDTITLQNLESDTLFNVNIHKFESSSQVQLLATLASLNLLKSHRALGLT